MTKCGHTLLLKDTQTQEKSQYRPPVKKCSQHPVRLRGLSLKVYKRFIYASRSWHVVIFAQRFPLEFC